MPFRISGHEQALHHVPHNVFRPLEQLVEEAMPMITKSPSTTPKHFNHLLSSPSGPSDLSDFPSVKTRTLQSLDELVIPHSSAPELTTSARCAECGGKLFSMREGGRFVTVPSDGDDTKARMYHTDCFKCVECYRAFKETNMGQAVFVKSKSGPCHVEVRLVMSPQVVKTQDCLIEVCTGYEDHASEVS
jgi:DNA-directed RNA polymerase subunit RPC12/RpoP